MSQTLLDHSGLFFLAKDNVVANPASIPAAATEPRKIPPVQEFGRKEIEVGEGRKKQKPEVKRWTQISFQILFKNQFGNSRNDS